MLKMSATSPEKINTEIISVLLSKDFTVENVN
jgi:hypothetical protein